MLSEELHAVQLLTRVPYGRVATSMRAMPFVAPACHVVTEGTILLRMHAGLGYHRACGGGVVAYGADNFGSAAAEQWSVQFTGTVEIVEPTDAEVELFDSRPLAIDGQPFDPIYMRFMPQLAAVHTVEYFPERRGQYVA
ncbi:pyridoxamine 5'-phosphate oxidase family protein [Streptomyces hebeiensis]